MLHKELFTKIKQVLNLKTKGKIQNFYIHTPLNSLYLHLYTLFGGANFINYHE